MTKSGPAIREAYIISDVLPFPQDRFLTSLLMSKKAMVEDINQTPTMLNNIIYKIVI